MTTQVGHNCILMAEHLPNEWNLTNYGGPMLAFTRGQGHDYYVLLNFGGWSGHRPLADLNLPAGQYRELWNSTWPVFAIQAEHEEEHLNGGHDARLHRGHGACTSPITAW